MEILKKLKAWWDKYWESADYQHIQDYHAYFYDLRKSPLLLPDKTKHIFSCPKCDTRTTNARWGTLDSKYPNHRFLWKCDKCQTGFVRADPREKFRPNVPCFRSGCTCGDKQGDR